MGLALYAMIVLLFAVWVTVHARLCALLLGHSAWRAAVGFLMPPFGLYWGAHYRIARWPSFWVLSFACYFVALLAGYVSQ